MTGIGPADAPVPPRADDVHPDRRRLSRGGLIVLTAATALSSGVAGLVVATRASVSGTIGFGVAAAVAVAVVVGVRSVSIRLAAQVMTMVSAAGLVRFGLLGGGPIGPGSPALLVWIVATVIVLVLTDRLGTDLRPALRGTSSPGGGWSVVRSTVLVTAAIGLFALLVGPPAQRHLSSASTTGAPPTGEEVGEDGVAQQLRSNPELDMATRPRLSDRVVLTIDADRPSFWRGETYDQWDGQRWTRSDRSRYPIDDSGSVQPDPTDLGAGGSDELRQRVRIEASFADVVYAAPSAVNVDIRQAVAQRRDGTLTTPIDAMGRGATYTVESRRVPTSPERLRAVDDQPTPESVEQLYAEPPVTTDRVAAVATRITAGVTTRYDTVEAIERWMGRRTTYSMEAPLAPDGSDVVDHFLFESREGWCEQVASSLVVLLRLNGVPARLVTGFVPGEREPLTSRFTVRERDAHAWAEVWFPEAGWVGFDPTARVPLAGQDDGDQTLAQWINDHLALLAVIVVAVALAAGPGGRLLRRRLDEARDRRHADWAARAAARLDRIGADADRPRHASETMATYGAVLGARLDDDRLARVGQLLDDAVYAPAPPDADGQAFVHATIDELGSRTARSSARPRTLIRTGR